MISVHPEFSLMLAPNHIEVYFIAPGLVTDETLLDAYLDLLSREEVSRWRRFVSESDRHDFLVSRALLRVALSRQANVLPESWVFTTNDYGRPEIAAPILPVGLRFNLSHTQGLVAVAVAAERAVGIDVEKVKPEFARDVAEIVLTSQEIAALEKLPTNHQAERFFRLWTLKEAYAKARGLGLSFPFREVSFDLDGEPPVQVAFGADCGDDPARWVFENPSLSPIHQSALVYEASPLVPVQVSIQELIPLGGAN